MAPIDDLTTEEILEEIAHMGSEFAKSIEHAQSSNDEQLKRAIPRFQRWLAIAHAAHGRIAQLTVTVTS